MLDSTVFDMKLSLCVSSSKRSASPSVQVEITGHKELGRGGCEQVVLASHAHMPHQFALKGVAADVDTLPTLQSLLDGECAMLGWATTPTSFRCADIIT